MLQTQVKMKPGREGGERATVSLRRTAVAKTRRTLAALLAIGAGLAAVLGFWQDCYDTVASVGPDPTVSICRTPILTDLPTIALVLLVLFLLWPDLSEMSVGGIRLKRLVEQNRKEMEAEVHQLRVQMAVAQQQNVNFSLSLAQPDLTAEAVVAIAEQTDTVDRSPADAEIILESDRAREEFRKEPTLEAFLARWATTESILLWLDRAERRQAVLRADSLSIPDQQILRVAYPMPVPLLGMGIPPHLEAQAIEAVKIAQAPYQQLITAAASARNILIHRGEPLESEIVGSLTDGLTEFQAAVRVRIARLLREAGESDTASPA